MTTTSFDQAKAEAFAGKMVSVLNQGSLALMTSIGHRTGLFDALANQPPATSKQIAAQTGLQERYVREWLHAMATGRVVEYNPADQTFQLPAEHSMWLTRAAGVNNFANFIQFVPVLAQVEDPILECFKKGGGVSYSGFRNFHSLMAESSAPRTDLALINSVVPLIAGLSDQLRMGIDVLDVGCGSGHAMNVLGKAFPKSRFMGYDFTEECIANAEAETRTLGLTNVRFKVQDIAQLNHTQQFDLITAFDSIHDQAKPAVVLQNIANALKPNGVFLMVDIRAGTPLEENLDHMLGTFLYTVSTMHCMTVSLAQDGAGLGTAWGEQLALKMLADAGFTQVEVKQVEGDILNNFFIARKS